ncbi:MAG: dihydroorotate dehydrogenase electron transfer subunit [Elusimicrobiales bacterium]
MRARDCRLLSNRKAAEGIYLAVLSAPEIAAEAAPGQFVHASLGDGGHMLRRPFSIHGAADGKIEILYRVVGAATLAMSSLRAGATLNLLGPLGKPFPAPRGRALLLCGGMGAAPLAFLARRLAGKTEMTALIGAKTASSVLCAGGFRKAGAKVMVCTEDGSRGRRGLVTEQLEALAAPQTAVFACGPNGMLKRAAQICARAGARCWVSLEEKMACGIGVCLCCPVPVVSGGYKSVCKDGPVFAAGEVDWRNFR